MIIHYTQEVDKAKQRLTLIDDEAQHCAKVLRSREGDSIYATDGEGILYTATLVSVNKLKCIAEITEIHKTPLPKYQLTIAICPTKKQSRIEWFVEKAVEIGVARIIMMHTKRTEKPRIKVERLNKIIISAMKQSKNLYKPELIMNTSYEQVITLPSYGTKYIAHCEDPSQHLSRLCKPHTDCIVAIGPEGDFTGPEIQQAHELGWQEVNLGASRLRTETAGVVVASILSQLNI